MKRRNFISLGEAIDTYMKAYGIDGKMDEQKLLSAYSSVAGPAIAAYTRRTEIRNGVLYIELLSSAARNELRNEKLYFIKRLNDSVGRQIIKDIVLR